MIRIQVFNDTPMYDTICSHETGRAFTLFLFFLLVIMF